MGLFSLSQIPPMAVTCLPARTSLHCQDLDFMDAISERETEPQAAKCTLRNHRGHVYCLITIKMSLIIVITCIKISISPMDSIFCPPSVYPSRTHTTSTLTFLLPDGRAFQHRLPDDLHPHGNLLKSMWSSSMHSGHAGDNVNRKKTAYTVTWQECGESGKDPKRPLRTDADHLEKQCCSNVLLS